ncbi:energy transducer TonB [Pseudomonas sp. REP124]|uniref:energy transducer TonB n=1 Tax=Pseudomonas sp. REP124 TaxID=2875731 RepID=UPI001CC95FB4|nr:energy transducer TonB [Pseudomonas sp. REP124]MBZ9782732.1 energy transducer TonB [Pseudomonas sp. REP124]
MRWLLCGVLLILLSIESRAGDEFLIPEHNPRPIYPAALQRAGITGDVRVSFVAYADGSVGEVKILESDHPDLAEASRVAIEKWRFKPWTVEGDKPAEQEVIAPMIFGYDASLPRHLNQWLGKLKCRDLNQFLVRTADQAWVDLPAFHYTRAYLTNSFSRAMLSDERRLELIAKMNRSVPYIGRQCLNNPGSRFARYLPEDIRKLL